MSFAEKIKNSKSELLYLVRGNTEGKAVWHYVLVDKLKISLFLRAMDSGNIDVANFGEVLRSGWGDNPSDEVRAAIISQFS